MAASVVSFQARSPFLQPKAAEPGGIHILTGTAKLMGNFKCRNHKWTWPQTSERFDYASAVDGGQFDSHQTCTECGIHRLFESREFQPGPLFREVYGGR